MFWMDAVSDWIGGTEDGKQLDMDLQRMKIRDVVAEVDRHSRGLARQEELKG